MMKNNMSNLDRIVRSVIALVLGVLIFGKFITGTLAIVLGVVAVVFLLTALLGFCPLYSLLKLSTKN
jgi:hypothetical protein